MPKSQEKFFTFSQATLNLIGFLILDLVLIMSETQTIHWLKQKYQYCMDEAVIHGLLDRVGAPGPQGWKLFALHPKCGSNPCREYDCSLLSTLTRLSGTSPDAMPTFAQSLKSFLESPSCLILYYVRSTSNVGENGGDVPLEVVLVLELQNSHFLLQPFLVAWALR